MSGNLAGSGIKRFGPVPSHRNIWNQNPSGRILPEVERLGQISSIAACSSVSAMLTIHHHGWQGERISLV